VNAGPKWQRLQLPLPTNRSCCAAAG
jgi:hypothetical protein